MLRIVADDKIPFLKGVLEPFAEVSYIPGERIDNKCLQNADALLIRTRTRCTPELLEGTSVRFIATATIGYDHIDTSYCDSKGIRWANAPGCNAGSVQQYLAVALIKLAEQFNFSLSDRILGIIGVGHVGTKLKNIASAFEMQTLLNDPPRERLEGSENFVTIEKLVSEADIISLNVPLTYSGPDSTYHLLDQSLFSMMKPSAMIINTARGEVIKTSQLLHALETGRIKTTVLDVWENEPFIDADLLNRCFIATPHIAGYSVDGKANATSSIIRSLGHWSNLPLLDWFPVSLPEPMNTEFYIDCSSKNTEMILYEVLSQTYDLFRDDQLLRSNPANFERFRENYPIRREFSSFTVHLQNPTGSLISILKELGFQHTVI